MISTFEDHFSKWAQDYARYRPTYSGELFDYLAALSPSRTLAWDCGTGNGQAARELARRFDRVLATDASAGKIAQAAAQDSIEFRVERAEDVELQPSSVDLITAAQAVHWFDLESFYRVVRRIARPGGILAVWMYHLPAITPSIDKALDEYYTRVVAGYWPERFHYVDERYQTLPFPFDEIRSPEFIMLTDWNLG